MNINQKGNEMKLSYYQTPEFQKNLRNLNPMERKYFNIMRSQYGVLFIQSRPGVGKSAIAKSIANRMGLQYVDIRLSMADETDMQFPNLVHNEDLGQHVIEHAIPQWAVIANEKPTLIHFEELNRAPLAVRNAALQILLERGIGPKFKFNENVFMMSSGNLGDEDDTDVEEFDAALKNRLINIKHDLTTPEWLKWAEGNVHPDVTSFIGLFPDYYYKKGNSDESVYASPRSWTMLSSFLYKNFGGGAKVDPSTLNMKNVNGTNTPDYSKADVYRHEDGTPIFFSDGFVYNDGEDLNLNPRTRNWGDANEYTANLQEICYGIVGTVASNRFLQFLNERTRITLDDILKGYDKVKGDLQEKFGRDKYSELLTTAKDASIDKWGVREIDNFTKFLKDCAPDERVSFLLEIVDMAQAKYKGGIEQKSVMTLMRNFRDDLMRVKQTNNMNKR